jgi:hypothetical protein
MDLVSALFGLSYEVEMGLAWRSCPARIAANVEVLLSYWKYDHNVNPLDIPSSVTADTWAENMQLWRPG